MSEAYEVLGYDCDKNAIEEFRILWAIFRNDENIEDMKDEDPREYCAIIAADGKAYAISVYDQYNAKSIREREHIPDYEEIPTLIKPIASMEHYECACGEEPIYYDRDRKELKEKLNNMLKENPFETKTIDEINSDIRKMKSKGINIDEISDGHHTIGEYKEGAVWDFIVMCHAYPDISWKSKKHYDEKNDPISNFNDDFIAGINTPAGPITKHIKMKYWDQLDVKEIEHAPKYDGYTKQDENERKKSLYKQRGKN